MEFEPVKIRENQEVQQKSGVSMHMSGLNRRRWLLYVLAPRGLSEHVGKVVTVCLGGREQYRR